MFALPCLLFQADCFVRGLTLRSNNVVENLCKRPNIGPAAAGPAGPVAMALCSGTSKIYLVFLESVSCTH